MSAQIIIIILGRVRTVPRSCSPPLLPLVVALTDVVGAALRTVGLALVQLFREPVLGVPALPQGRLAVVVNSRLPETFQFF